MPPALLRTRRLKVATALPDANAPADEVVHFRVEVSAADDVAMP